MTVILIVNILYACGVTIIAQYVTDFELNDI